MTSRWGYRPSLVAMGVSLAFHSAAFAQETARSELETIIVTGSFIRGAAEDAALPIDVLTSDDLQKQGSPTMTELIKALPSAQGVFGDSNQFGAGQSTGSANVNLRGLGALRTLVLLNGKRVAPNPAIGVGVDINLLPTAAIERIEVLKDGAAATYGSDAIAGVVNFITRESMEGLQVDGSYTYIDDSDGDYGANFAYGWRGENTDLLVAAGYRHRSELHVRDRDWALRSYEENPSGGWTSFGSPGAFQAGATRFIDPQCESLDGVPTGTVGGVSGTPTAGTAVAPVNCQFQYTAFANLVEREEHYQIFGQVNHRFSERTSLHAELLYAGHDVPEENSSPSYGPNQGPNGGAPNFFIPLANPGFTELLPQLSNAARNAVLAAGGTGTSGLFWRPLGAGGNTLTGEGKKDERLFYSYRGSVGLAGELGETTTWDASVTYSETTADVATPDMLVSRLDLALRGFGGPNCAGGGAPGTGGCLWFNPFSTGVPRNVARGGVNPIYDSASANSREVVDWIYEDFAYELTSSLLSLDVVFSGDTGLTLPGGQIGWATGAQYRENGAKRDPNDISDISLFPCAASPVNPAATCNTNGQFTGTGPFSFNGALTEYDLKQDLYAVFGELSLPLTDSFQAQLALRYEDYGGGIGDTLDPKLALRWQVTDSLVLRGSASTTFRAPPPTQTVPSFIVSSAFTAAAGGYKPYRTSGNPDLKPETATSFNVGAVMSLGGFRGSVDYWQFDFQDVIENESGNDLIARFYQGATVANPAPNCGNPELAALQQRLTFTGACGPASSIVITDIRSINGADVKVSGLDASLQYTFDGVFGGELSIGVDGTYNLKYDQGANFIAGVQVRAADDYVGTRGTNSSQPRWKGAAFTEYTLGNHNLRYSARYIGEMEDTRVQSSTAAFANITPGSPGSTVDSYLTHDLYYRLGLAADLIFNASLLNVADEDPPFARLDLNYDPFTGSPVGRSFKIGLTKTF